MDKKYPDYKCYRGEVQKFTRGILHLDIGGSVLKFRLSAISEVIPGTYIVVAYKDSDKKKIRDARLYCELSEEEKEFEMSVAGEFVSYKKGIMTIKPYGSKKREQYRVETDKKIGLKMFVSLGYSSIDRSKIPMARVTKVMDKLRPLTEEEVASIPCVTDIRSLPNCKWD